jgi:hypothetical protein
MEDQQPPAGPEITQESAPDWWPCSAEFPLWHVWRGVGGLVYARRLRTSPPVVMCAEDATDLRDQIKRVEDWKA